MPLPLSVFLSPFYLNSGEGPACWYIPSKVLGTTEVPREGGSGKQVGSQQHREPLFSPGRLVLAVSSLPGWQGGDGSIH